MSAPPVPVAPVVDGAHLLDEVCATFRRFVAFTAPEHAEAVTLFTAATHGQPAWEHATRLVIKSPLKQCGKTRLQEIISGLAHQALRTVNISSAALVRSIDEHEPPALLLDEADSVFATRKGERSEKAEDLRGILNSGHSRGWPYIRWDIVSRSNQECPTFAMSVLSGIGDFPDTIEDRAVIVPMRRRAPGENVQQYRTKRVVPILRDLRDQLHAWVRERLDELGNAEPDLPVDDRPADVWEPLVAIADAAGGDWPDRARRACMVMTGAIEPDDATASERLFVDLRPLFYGSADQLFPMPLDHLPTTEILQQLNALDESPWATGTASRLTLAAWQNCSSPTASDPQRPRRWQAGQALSTGRPRRLVGALRPSRPSRRPRRAIVAGHAWDGWWDG